ncbi:MAG: hypothetical protein RLZZ308_176 [Candidatus Parcubacteria bacterium]|jgi:F0F1-type ATP synthase delta subunit
MSSLSHKIAAAVYTHKIEGGAVIAVLEKYRLTALLPEICTILKQIFEKEKEGKSVVIHTPFFLSDEAVSHIKKKIGAEHATSRVILKKNLLAGFKATYNNTLYDGSAERIIKQFISN